MKLFGRKKEDGPAERNEINNPNIKEALANTAISILEQGVDYDDLANTKVTFGYVFDIDNHGFEALFKVITDKTICYFAAQGENLIRLNFNEDLFKSTVEGFLERHE